MDELKAGCLPTRNRFGPARPDHLPAGGDGLARLDLAPARPDLTLARPDLALARPNLPLGCQGADSSSRCSGLTCVDSSADLLSVAQQDRWRSQRTTRKYCTSILGACRFFFLFHGTCSSCHGSRALGMRSRIPLFSLTRIRFQMRILA